MERIYGILNQAAGQAIGRIDAIKDGVYRSAKQRIAALENCGGISGNTYISVARRLAKRARIITSVQHAYLTGASLLLPDAVLVLDGGSRALPTPSNCWEF